LRGTAINLGNIIVGDANGVIVIPQVKEQYTLEKLEKDEINE